MTKLTVAFRNFANASKNDSLEWFLVFGRFTTVLLYDGKSWSPSAGHKGIRRRVDIESHSLLTTTRDEVERSASRQASLTSGNKCPFPTKQDTHCDAQSVWCSGEDKAAARLPGKDPWLQGFPAHSLVTTLKTPLRRNVTRQEMLDFTWVWSDIRLTLEEMNTEPRS